MNRRSRALATLAGCVLACSANAFSSAQPPLAAHGTVQAAFTPWDDVESLIVEVIDGACKQVLVQAYLLTSRNIATALVAAKRRGVDVRVLADEGQHGKVESSALRTLSDAGIEVWLETRYQNAHNKIMVVDAATPQATVITGSFNFTWTAQHRNAENVLILRNNPELASRYALNWERHRREALLYKK